MVIQSKRAKVRQMELSLLGHSIPVSVFKKAIRNEQIKIQRTNGVYQKVCG